MMDQATALRLFEEGAVLVVLDVPVGTEFGVDYNSWHVGPKFRGVKMVPPGVHFVYWAASAGGGGRQTGPRTGTFVRTERRQVLAWRWNPKTEDLDPADDVQAALTENRAGLLELDRFLGAYPFDDGLRKWLSLTSKISGALVERLSPSSGKIFSVPAPAEPSTEAEAAADGGAAAMEDVGAGEGGGGDVDESTRVRFSGIPTRLIPPGSSAADVSRWSIDRTPALMHVLDVLGPDGPTQMLGELQFAFVVFVLGEVYDAFEQWKKIVVLLCNCEEALLREPRIFYDFISVLHFQLKETPDDFFVDSVSQSNFLTTSLQRLFSNINTTDGVSEELKDHSSQLQRVVSKRFDYDFDAEDEDEAPTVIHMGEPEDGAAGMYQ